MCELATRRNVIKFVPRALHKPRWPNATVTTAGRPVVLCGGMPSNTHAAHLNGHASPHTTTRRCYHSRRRHSRLCHRPWSRHAGPNAGAQPGHRTKSRLRRPWQHPLALHCMGVPHRCRQHLHKDRHSTSGATSRRVRQQHHPPSCGNPTLVGFFLGEEAHAGVAGCISWHQP